MTRSIEKISLQQTQDGYKKRPPEARDILDKNDKYKVDHLIAQGGMAMVFKAKDKNCRRSVALKIIRDRESQNQEIVHRFIEEAQIAAQLDHPNILPIYELNIDSQDTPYYTMKLVEGDTFDSLLNKIKRGDKETIGKYPINRLLQLYIKICEAVAFADSKGVIHRDLKPENIMVGEFGEVFIMDWGIAKIAEKEDLPVENQIDDYIELIDSISKDSDFNTTTTIHGQILGTPCFMAPEQILSDRGTINSQTDVYALGGILYNILSLETPHPELDLKTLFKNKLAGKVQTPKKRAADCGNSLAHLPQGKIPEALSSICKKAMATRPEDRYAKANNVIQDINSYINGYATNAEGASQLRLLKLLLFRHRRLSFSFILLMTMIVLYLTQSYFKLQYAEVTSETAKSYAEEMQGRKSKMFTHISNAADNILPEMEAQIKILIEQKNLSRALTVTESLLTLSKNSHLYYLKATILLQDNLPDKSLETIKLGLKMSPNDKSLLELKAKITKN